MEVVDLSNASPLLYRSSLFFFLSVFGFREGFGGEINHEIVFIYKL